MLFDKKKIASIILKGLDDSAFRGARVREEQSVKSLEDHEKSDRGDSSVEPMQMAVEKLFEAFEKRDARKGMEALMEFQEMCGSNSELTEDYKQSLKEDII